MSNLPIDPDLPELEPGEPRFETYDEIFFDVFAQGGESALRESLDLLPDLAREPLEDAAAALRKAGKRSAAAIVLQIASKRPSELAAIVSRYPEGHVYRICKRNIWFVERARITGEPEASLRARYSEIWQ
jgi:hypothetical protein